MQVTLNSIFTKTIAVQMICFETSDGVYKISTILPSSKTHPAQDTNTSSSHIQRYQIPIIYTNASNPTHHTHITSPYR